MAAGILENDNLFVVGERAWHGLGVRLDNPINSEDALRIAHLDWSVEQVPIYAGTKQVEGYLGNVRSDTKECLGIITSKYKILQNIDAFSFVDDIMNQDSIECKYESAGSLYNGQRVWMLAKMPSSFILGDEVDQYLYISNSHNGKSSVHVGCTSIRIVCANTLNLAMNSAKRTWSARHMGSIEGRKQEAMETLGFAQKYIDAMKIKAEEMAAIKFDINTFVDQLFPFNEEASNRIKNNQKEVRDYIISVHNNKNDLGNFRSTAWGCYNAFADWMSNSEPQRKSSTFETNRFVSMLDGSDLNIRAQEILAI